MRYVIYFRKEIIKEFEKADDAYQHLELIREQHPGTYLECKLVDTEEWSWQDSGIEQGF